MIINKLKGKYTLSELSWAIPGPAPIFFPSTYYYL